MITSEEMRSKRGLKALGLALAVGIAFEGAITLFTGGKTTQKYPMVEIQRPGGLFSTKEKREYLGALRTFYRGAEQKVYIDRAPFGSVDGVVTRLYSDSGRLPDLPERKPSSEEEETFLVLQDHTKREHPAWGW
jgi:hypothetical protein